MDGFGVVREVPRALDVDAAELLEIHRLDDVRRIDVLPDVMRRIVRLLQRAVIVKDSVHQLAGRKAAGQVVVGVRRRDGEPALHRAVLHAHGHAERLRVVQDRLEHLLELEEVLLEAAVGTTEDVIIADERAADNIVRVATKHRRHADQLEDVVLVRELHLLGLRADEVVVGADGNADVLVVADLKDTLRALGREVVVVEVRGDVVLAVSVPAEDAQLEALRADGFRALHDGLEVRIGGERARHQPDRIVAGLGLGRMRQRLLRGKGSHGGKCRSSLEKLSSVHFHLKSQNSTSYF